MNPVTIHSLDLNSKLLEHKKTVRKSIPTNYQILIIKQLYRVQKIYYEGMKSFIKCNKNIFEINETTICGAIVYLFRSNSTRQK